MGNADTKLNFRKAVVQLTTKTQVTFSHYIYNTLYIFDDIIAWDSHFIQYIIDTLVMIFIHIYIYIYIYIYVICHMI